MGGEGGRDYIGIELALAPLETVQNEFMYVPEFALRVVLVTDKPLGGAYQWAFQLAQPMHATPQCHATR